MRARLKKDLIDAKHYPALWNARGHFLEDISQWYNFPELFEAFQPEAWKRDEYNTILIDCMGNMLLCNSVDFEFFEKSQVYV